MTYQTKYELTNTTKDQFDITLYQIKALKDFGGVKTGDLGGWVASEKNLSQEGNCWVYGNAGVYGDAGVHGNAGVYGNAEVYGDAKVSGNAVVYGNAEVYGDAKVYGNAKVFGNAGVSGNAGVYGNAEVYGNAKVSGNAGVYGNAKVYGNAEVSGNAKVYGNAEVKRGKYIKTPTSITRSDGYTFTLQQDLSIVAGCRDFDQKGSEEHWGDPKHHMHKESWTIVQALWAIQEAKG
jgi:carbonic anhydrase/acetyltransferase-like protein (isoleucine patch superfamily)